MRKFTILSISALLVLSCGQRNNVCHTQCVGGIDSTLQALAYNALIDSEKMTRNIIMGGCITVMEVDCGYVRAEASFLRTENEMVDTLDLTRTITSPLSGLAQSAAYMYMIDEYGVSFTERIPTQHGRLDPNNANLFDVHVIDYECETGENTISLASGFRQSFKYPVSFMADSLIASDEQRVVDFKDRLVLYFDAYPALSISKGSDTTAVRNVVTGIGLKTTLFQAVNFYNSIASRGVKHGRDYCERICSEETSRRLSEMLREVVTDGTCIHLKRCEEKVAGKSGVGLLSTPSIFASDSEDTVYASTFIGFYPYESPKYTLGVTVFTSPNPDYVLPKLVARRVIERNEHGYL